MLRLGRWRRKAHERFALNRAVAPAIKEGRKVVLTITCLFVIMAASAAFDVWVWVPRSIH